MIQKEFTVTNKLGIHVRPATNIVNVLSQFKSEITFIKDDISANAKSILNILVLAAEYQSKITVIAKGDDEQEIMELIPDLFGTKYQ